MINLKHLFKVLASVLENHVNLRKKLESAKGTPLGDKYEEKVKAVEKSTMDLLLIQKEIQVLDT